MALKVCENFICDVCGADMPPFDQTVYPGQELQKPPKKYENAVIYGGMRTDLCMMCAAPVHEALMQVFNRWVAENPRK